jgi:glycosyltransferase involved in cell wall biosynthesis
MKNVSVILPYANPHVLDWVLKLENVELNIGCSESTQKYRPGYFMEYDDIEGVKYFFKETEARNNFVEMLDKADVLITLGMFNSDLLKFRKYCNSDVSLVILSEPFNSVNSKKKLLIRKTWAFFIRKLYKNITFLCIGGKDVKEYYSSLGFEESEYYNFGYFPSFELNEKDSNWDTINIAFVGQLIDRKGADRLFTVIDELHKCKFNFVFDIVGDGILRDSLKRKLTELDDRRFVYHGLISNKNELIEIYKKCHLFFIPSYFDGWGAVVNEAVANSCVLIHSDRVYAALSLNDNGNIGKKFSNNQEMLEAFSFYFDNKVVLKEQSLNTKNVSYEWGVEKASRFVLDIMVNKELLDSKKYPFFYLIK